MVDLEQLVEIGWSAGNKSRYEELGYKFTKIREKFKVKAKELAGSSKVIIKVTCDYCEKTLEKRYVDYIWSINNSKGIYKDCCSKCRGVKNTGNTSNESKGGTKPCQPISEIKKEFDKRGLIMLSKKYTHKGQRLNFICPKHKHEIQNIRPAVLKKSRFGCKYCRYEIISIKNSGESGPNWQGGITELNQHLRKVISPWITDSMKQCKFKCVLTGERRKWHVHHTTSFNTIVAETLEYLNLPVKPTIGDYTEKEITLINNKCLQLHYEYGLGVCVREDLHTLFHCYYGYGDNTPEQWMSFIFRYKAGEFNE